MAKDAERDPTDALSRASMFPVRSLPAPTSPPESEREPAPSSTFAGEDFLFHLYRGSELLQDNCVEQAKEELEQALKLQPRDSEGQGLLGIVYFRLGMYPRAIEIYEELIRAWPNEITPKVNLSLCYLKTGQQHQARDVLEDVIRREPHHVRAWGYYGLALERLGDYAKAQAAFEKANQPHLALRMQRLAEEADGSAEQRDGEQQHDEVRRAAADAVQELDTHSELPFAQATDDRSELEPARSTRWRAVEPGEEPFPPASRAHRGPSLGMRLGSATVPSMQVDVAEAAPPSRRSVPPAAVVEAPPEVGILTPSALVAAVALAIPDARERVVIRGSVALVRSELGFALRNDALRAVVPDGAALARGALRRRMRGRDSDEPFGGPATPWSLLEGAGVITLAAAEGRSIAAVELGGEFVYLREARLLGFDSSARFENGRLPAPPQVPAPIVVVQLSGRGIVLLETERPLRALAVSSDRRLVVRSESVAGWTGRMLAQPLTADEAPTQAHGFVSFGGEGAVLLDDA